MTIITLPYYLLNSGDNFPILSINDANVIIDLLSKSPKQESIEIYNTNPIIHNIVKIIHNLALNKNLFTDRGGIMKNINNEEINSELFSKEEDKMLNEISDLLEDEVSNSVLVEVLKNVALYGAINYKHGVFDRAEEELKNTNWIRS